VLLMETVVAACLATTMRKAGCKDQNIFKTSTRHNERVREGAGGLPLSICKTVVERLEDCATGPEI